MISIFIFCISYFKDFTKKIEKIDNTKQDFIIFTVFFTKSWKLEMKTKRKQSLKLWVISMTMALFNLYNNKNLKRKSGLNNIWMKVKDVVSEKLKILRKVSNGNQPLSHLWWASLKQSQAEREIKWWFEVRIFFFFPKKSKTKLWAWRATLCTKMN